MAIETAGRGARFLRLLALCEKQAERLRFSAVLFSMLDRLSAAAEGSAR